LLRAVGPFWKQAVIVALVNELPPFEGDVIQALSESFNAEAVNLIQFYEGFIEQIDRWNLNNVWELKNLVNGNQLMEMYERKAGPWLAEALEKEMGWQLENPEKGKEECEIWLKENKEILLLQRSENEKQSRKKKDKS